MLTFNFSQYWLHFAIFVSFLVILVLFGQFLDKSLPHSPILIGEMSQSQPNLHGIENRRPYAIININSVSSSHFFSNFCTFCHGENGGGGKSNLLCGSRKDGSRVGWTRFQKSNYLKN